MAGSSEGLYSGTEGSLIQRAQSCVPPLHATIIPVIRFHFSSEASQDYIDSQIKSEGFRWVFSKGTLHKTYVDVRFILHKTDIHST